MASKKVYETFYKKQKFLNGKSLTGSGSAVAYHGKWKAHPYAYFEIADCHCKVRLHQMDGDTLNSFIKKMKRLQKVLNKYIIYLENYAK